MSAKKVGQVTATPTVYARPVTASLAASMVQQPKTHPRIASSVMQAVHALATRSSSSGEVPGSIQKAPLMKRPQNALGQSKVVNVNVRVIKPNRKSQYETYVLRNIGSHNISTSKGLKEEIFRQFGSDIVSGKLDFPVGYMKGGSKVWVRASSDIEDIWTFVSKGENITLWCNGISSATQKTQLSSGSESDDDSYSKKPRKKKKVSALEEKNERVEEIVANLRQKHGTQFTSIQYRLWAEMVDVGTHK